MTKYLFLFLTLVFSGNVLSASATQAECNAILAQLRAAQAVYREAREVVNAAQDDVAAKQTTRDIAYANRNKLPRAENLATWVAAENALTIANKALNSAKTDRERAMNQVNLFERRHHACLAKLPKSATTGPAKQ